MADEIRPPRGAGRLSAPLRDVSAARKDSRLHLRPAGKPPTQPARTDRVVPPRKPTRFDQPSSFAGLTAIEVGALIFTLAWLGLSGWFFLALPDDQAPAIHGNPMGLVTTILGVFLPLALVWFATSAARTAQTMRDESANLRAAMETMRTNYLASQKQESEDLKREIDARLEQVSHAQAVLSAELAALQRPMEPAAVLTAPERPAASSQQQPTLALETEPEAGPLLPQDFIRALNFPENENDQEGFDVLRRALKHHDTARLVTAAQDLLTLLAQDGIYMDDLTVHRADPVLWRAFADGTHGADVAALGGIRDRSSLALTSGRMKDDPVFRDAIHHFLRTFDQVFAGFAATATDGELMAFANTRTARAFMLCARVAGTFD